MNSMQREVLATLESMVQKIVDTNNEKVQQQHQEILDYLSVRTVSLGTDRYYNRYWVIPAFPDKLWVEDCSVLTASFRPAAVSTFLETKGKISTKVAAAHNRVMELLDAASIPVLRKAGQMLGLSFDDSEPKNAMIKEVMAQDTTGEVVGDLLKQLDDHKSRYYATTLLSLEELAEWELAFPEKSKKSAAKNLLSKHPTVKTEEELSAEETAGSVEDRQALSQQLAETVLTRPGASERLAAEFYQRGVPKEPMILQVQTPIDALPSAKKIGTLGSSPTNHTVDIDIVETGALGLKFDQLLTIEHVDSQGAGYKSGVRLGMRLLRFQGLPVQGFDSTMALLVGTPRPWRFTFQRPDTTQSIPAKLPAVPAAEKTVAGVDTADRDESVEGVDASLPRSTALVQAEPTSLADDVSAVATNAAATVPGSDSGGTTAVAAAVDSAAVKVADTATDENTSELRQRQPRQKKTPAVSLPPEITVRLEAAYQKNKAAEAKARAAAERERSKRASGATSTSASDSLSLDRMNQSGQCKACLGSHRAHTCGKRKTLRPDVVVTKPKLGPLVDIPNYNEDEELRKISDQQSKETGVDAVKIWEWFEQRRRTTAKRRGGGRTRSRAEQINELKSRSNPNWVPVGNSKSKSQRDRTKDRGDAASAKQVGEQDASSSWKWDLSLPPLIPPELEKLPLQPPGAVEYWEKSDLPSVHIVKNSRWRCYEDPEDVDALLAYLNPTGRREAALRRRLLIQAPALKSAMTATKVQVRKAAIEAEKLSQAAALALTREETGLLLRRSRSASTKKMDADSAKSDGSNSKPTDDGVVARSEHSRRCDLIKDMLFQILEALPTLSTRVTHGNGLAKWRNAVTAAVAQEDWKALLAPALTLSLDVQMVGMAYERTIRNVGSKKKKDDPDPDPGGVHHSHRAMLTIVLHSRMQSVEPIL
jgi:hypothetical protein